MTGTGRNLSDALRFREAVALFAMLSGIDDAVARPTLRKISPHIGQPPQPDVLIPGRWALGTSSRISFKLSADLASAQSVADDNGLPRAALVQHRSGRPLADSFVVLDLATFADLIAASKT